MSRARVSPIDDTRSVAATSAATWAMSDGCYEAGRAAALSGVPKTTVYWWASHDVVVPSVSSSREKLWSYADLMALRIVSWLRHPKEGRLPASPMRQVRDALALLARNGMDLWSRDEAVACRILVDGAGAIFVGTDDGVLDLRGHPAVLPEEALDLTGPFIKDGSIGPDLIRPRPHLRIVPSKVCGEPHLEHSRITTLSVAALARRGYSIGQISDLYEKPGAVVAEALDLERQLSANHVAAA
jgi:uncharacterized protein (DUF433 family)